MSFVPLFPGVPGGLELAVILLIAILLFGANKIPKLARSTGQAMGEFRKGREEIEEELQEMQETADPTADVTDDDSSTSSDSSTDSSTGTSTSTSTSTSTERES
jgi:sec-independent protein translocase protein TatA